MSKESIFIQNIISPYRNRFFNRLNQEFDRFSVFYMSYTEPDRNWDTNALIRNYDHWVDESGHIVKVGWYGGHLNPRLIWKVLRSKETNNIVLAVSWKDPNILILTFAKRIGLLRKKIFFWAEANYLAEWSKKHNSKFKWWLKKRVFGTVDGAMIIPGRMSEISFEKWGIPVKNYIHLPNTIDDANYSYCPSLRNASSIPQFIIPIRLIERVKGGINFFTAIGAENIKKARFIIAGDGEDRDLYKEYIEKNGYGPYILLAGFCDAAKMSELYSQVDAIILPSFSDPSPLSLVEALFFHLPILCSSHCGNHYEAVLENENGLTFSPLDHAEIKRCFETFMSLREHWREMGERSAEIYEQAFNTDKVVKNFVEEYKKFMKK